MQNTNTIRLTYKSIEATLLASSSLIHSFFLIISFLFQKLARPPLYSFLISLNVKLLELRATFVVIVDKSN
jgi:hypothetical protein